MLNLGDEFMGIHLFSILVNVWSFSEWKTFFNGTRKIKLIKIAWSPQLIYKPQNAQILKDIINYSCNKHFFGKESLMRAYVKGALHLVFHNMIVSGSIFFICSILVGNFTYINLFIMEKMNQLSQ